MTPKRTTEAQRTQAREKNDRTKPRTERRISVRSSRGVHCASVVRCVRPCGLRFGGTRPDLAQGSSEQRERLVEKARPTCRPLRGWEKPIHGLRVAQLGPARITDFEARRLRSPTTGPAALARSLPSPGVRPELRSLQNVRTSEPQLKQRQHEQNDSLMPHGDS
jgi:hypothetical protein